MRRTRLRRAVGREWFIAQRRIRDRRSGSVWAAREAPQCGGHEVFAHSSLIRRQLAGVDMRLQENKATNLSIAAGHLDGVVIRPGEVFSMWRLVGKPTRRKGYLEGLVIDQGQVSSGVGGGLCQLSNLLFWVFAHSGLEIVERHRHTYDVFPDAGRKVPFGAGATVSFNYIDLRVSNPTQQTFQLRVRVSDTHLVGSLTSNREDPRQFKLVERDHRFEHQPWGGYSRHNAIVRQTHIGEEMIDEQVLIRTDALVVYSPVLTGPDA